MKDRTTKSMTNVWTKINKDIAELGGLDAGTGSAITTPKNGHSKINFHFEFSLEFRKLTAGFGNSYQEKASCTWRRQPRRTRDST